MTTSDQVRLGRRIRALRKERGLSMNQLAEMVGVNYTTIHRVETGKVSPSVVLLSEIAHYLGHSIVSLLDEERAQIKFIRAEEQPEVESDLLNIRLLVPKGFVNDNISLSLGKAKVGECVGKHTTEGYELAYILEGSCLFKYGGQDFVMKAGDLVYFDGGVFHAVEALEPFVFMAIHFMD